jgi:hypothetical protein
MRTHWTLMASILTCSKSISKSDASTSLALPEAPYGYTLVICLRKRAMHWGNDTKLN